ncbi:MAG: FlgB family protein [Rhodobacteraceae bacterium]|nr:MAG: FlgB family protein [Paracoccaceae bacterium]
MQDIAILRMAQAVARHAAGRHELVSKNVANADTPGFRARDLEPLDLDPTARTPMKATRPAHLGANGEARLRAVFASAPGAAGPNGNDVSVEDQIARATSALGAHERAMAVYQKTLDIVRLGLGRGGR